MKPRPSQYRLAILTNLLAPYRLPIFQRLAEQFEVTVLLSGPEHNRTQWDGVESQLQHFRIKQSAGFTWTWVRREGRAVFDTRHLHVNPGLLIDLFRTRPDLLLSDEMGFRTLVALLYGRMRGKPVWVWWGGTLHTERGIIWPKRLFRKWLIRRVGRWFSYGRSSTEYLASLGVPLATIMELQNCIPEVPYLAPQRALFYPKTRPVLLCVGQLVPRKGVDLLLDAVARLQSEGHTFSVLIVGDGPEKSDLQRRAAELALQDVHFEAPQSPTRMPSVYRSGDVFVFPTREDVWGLVVNEALWSGLPALVSIYAGCAEELVPAASRFDPLNPAEFVMKLRLALSGQIPPPDRSRLKPIAEVSSVIIRELKRALGEQR